MKIPPPAPAWARAKKPWDAACRLKVIRSDYRPNEVIDPGVNFFVLTLEALGATPVYSCEGHPAGFYVMFYASYPLARFINSLGFFSVESSTSGMRDCWCMRLNHTTGERDKRRVLRWAAEAWQKACWLAPADHEEVT